MSSSVESGKTTVGAARVIDAKLANMFLSAFNISWNNKRYHHLAVVLEQTYTKLAKELLLQVPSQKWKHLVPNAGQLLQNGVFCMVLNQQDRPEHEVATPWRTHIQFANLPVTEEKEDEDYAVVVFL